MYRNRAYVNAPPAGLTPFDPEPIIRREASSPPKRTDVRALLLLTLLLPAALPGANVCVWNYDPVDRFYDPQGGDSVDCAYRVRQTLAAQGHAVTVTTELPSDLSGYDVVFCLMGWFRC